MEILLIGGMIVILIGSILWHAGRSQEVLQFWAAENGYRIIEAKYAYVY